MKLFNSKSMKSKRRVLRNEMPEPERILWYHLRKKQLNGAKFRRQVSIGDYIVDFYCPDQGLVIEIDGDSHYTRDALENDIERDKYLTDCNLTVIRFTNREVRESLEGVLDRIIEYLS